ncbi:DUF707 domain-containing protein [Aestuariivirga litoralis]|uniref:DUF707 domain-containing protein n=1 Tax=Aestuariivirga litoralis TaxID=2650924 RepID=UPI0018C69B18
MSAPARRNLVVVRAGESSLHRAWLKGAETRNWDLVVSWYASSSYKRTADERLHRVQGGKLDGLYKTFAALPDLLRNYDFIWLPDDDIDTNTPAINRLFETMRTHNLSIGQPALSWNSYFSHIITLRSPLAKLRFTNFVEVMAPCFAVDALRQTLPDFRESMSGWGVDRVWFTMLGSRRNSMAVIDQVSVFHTRPVGNVLASKVLSSGKTPRGEQADVMARHGLQEKPTHLCFGYIDLRGKQKNGNLFRRLRLALAQYGMLAETPIKQRARDQLWQQLWGFR